jgi:hypothetical protein
MAEEKVSIFNKIINIFKGNIQKMNEDKEVI